MTNAEGLFVVTFEINIRSKHDLQGINQNIEKKFRKYEDAKRLYDRAYKNRLTTFNPQILGLSFPHGKRASIVTGPNLSQEKYAEDDKMVDLLGLDRDRIMDIE